MSTGQISFHELEGNLVSSWALSAFLLFASVGVYTAIRANDGVLSIPPSQARLIVGGMLAVSIGVGVLALVEYLIDYFDSNVDRSSLSNFDHFAVWVQASMMLVFIMAQVFLTYYVIKNSFKK